MVALWSEAGFEPAGFWDQTPRTLDAILKGYVQRRQIENDQFMSLAWHMEALSRSGRKFPSLVSLLGRKGSAETRKQSNEEILAAMRTWAAMQNERVLKEEGQGGA